MGHLPSFTDGHEDFGQEEMDYAFLDDGVDITSVGDQSGVGGHHLPRLDGLLPSTVPASVRPVYEPTLIAVGRGSVEMESEAMYGGVANGYGNGDLGVMQFTATRFESDMPSLPQHLPVMEMVQQQMTQTAPDHQQVPDVGSFQQHLPDMIQSHAHGFEASLATHEPTEEDMRDAEALERLVGEEDAMDEGGAEDDDVNQWVVVRNCMCWSGAPEPKGFVNSYKGLFDHAQQTKNPELRAGVPMWTRGSLALRYYRKEQDIRCTTLGRDGKPKEVSVQLFLESNEPVVFCCTAHNGTRPMKNRVHGDPAAVLTEAPRKRGRKKGSGAGHGGVKTTGKRVRDTVESSNKKRIVTSASSSPVKVVRIQSGKRMPLPCASKRPPAPGDYSDSDDDHVEEWVGTREAVDGFLNGFSDGEELPVVLLTLWNNDKLREFRCGQYKTVQDNPYCFWALPGKTEHIQLSQGSLPPRAFAGWNRLSESVLKQLREHDDSVEWQTVWKDLDKKPFLLSMLGALRKQFYHDEDNLQTLLLNTSEDRVGKLMFYLLGGVRLERIHRRKRMSKDSLDKVWQAFSFAQGATVDCGRVVSLLSEWRVDSLMMEWKNLHDTIQDMAKQIDGVKQASKGSDDEEEREERFCGIGSEEGTRVLSDINLRVLDLLLRMKNRAGPYAAWLLQVIVCLQGTRQDRITGASTEGNTRGGKSVKAAVMNTIFAGDLKQAVVGVEADTTNVPAEWCELMGEQHANLVWWKVMEALRGSEEKFTRLLQGALEDMRKGGKRGGVMKNFMADFPIFGTPSNGVASANDFPVVYMPQREMLCVHLDNETKDVVPLPVPGKNLIEQMVALRVIQSALHGINDFAPGGKSVDLSHEEWRTNIRFISIRSRIAVTDTRGRKDSRGERGDANFLSNCSPIYMVVNQVDRDVKELAKNVYRTNAGLRFYMQRLASAGDGEGDSNMRKGSGLRILLNNKDNAGIMNMEERMVALNQMEDLKKMVSSSLFECAQADGMVFRKEDKVIEDLEVLQVPLDLAYDLIVILAARDLGLIDVPSDMDLLDNVVEATWKSDLPRLLREYLDRGDTKEDNVRSLNRSLGTLLEKKHVNKTRGRANLTSEKLSSIEADVNKQMQTVLGKWEFEARHLDEVIGNSLRSMRQYIQEKKLFSVYQNNSLETSIPWLRYVRGKQEGGLATYSVVMGIMGKDMEMRQILQDFMLEHMQARMTSSLETSLRNTINHMVSGLEMSVGSAMAKDLSVENIIKMSVNAFLGLTNAEFESLGPLVKPMMRLIVNKKWEFIADDMKRMLIKKYAADIWKVQPKESYEESEDESYRSDDDYSDEDDMPSGPQYEIEDCMMKCQENLRTLLSDMTKAYRAVWKDIGRVVSEHIMMILEGDASPMQGLIAETTRVLGALHKLIHKVVSPRKKKDDKMLTAGHDLLLTRLAKIYGVSVSQMYDNLVRGNRFLRVCIRMNQSSSFITDMQITDETTIARSIQAKTATGEYVPFSMVALLMGIDDPHTARKVADLWMPLVGSKEYDSFSDKFKEIEVLGQIARMADVAIILLQHPEKGFVFGSVIPKRGQSVTTVAWQRDMMVLLK